MTYLNLEYNRFVGTLPKELSHMPLLSDFNLQYNQVAGPLPSELGLLTHMTRLNLRGNDLSGTLPEELSEMQQSLFELYLEENPLLTGIVPEALCYLNGTCTDGNIKTCDEPVMLVITCSNTTSLCGCDCPC